MGDTKIIRTIHTTDSPGQKLIKNISETPVDLKLIDNRLDTFRKWPNTKLSPKVLADAGFYFTGYADVVRCAFCGVEGRHWDAKDDPMADHREWRADCPFVQRKNSRTVTVDTCGKHDLADETPQQAATIGTEEVKNIWGASVGRGPLHTDFVSKERRMETFNQWPKCMKQKPAELAEAGFYYLGVGDQTICFYCGGGLKDWEETDDPWEQHAFWFPKCNHVILKKGQEFIDRVVEKKDEGRNGALDEPGSSGLSRGATEEATEATTTAATTTAETKDNLNGDQDANAVPICKICYVNQVNVMFLPCGHIISCIDCSEALKQCPICRQNITFVARGFF